MISESVRRILSVSLPLCVAFGTVGPVLADTDKEASTAPQAQLEKTTHPPADAQAVADQVDDPPCDPKRAEQALSLIESAKAYIKRATENHRTSELLIAQANKLKGEAHLLQKKVAPAVKKLSPSQYKAATSQFEEDVELFKDHARMYNQHMDAFKMQVGECNASRAMYEAQVKGYQLHANRYHSGNIPPPHICVSLDLTTGEAMGIANTLQTDRQRLLKAEQDLAQQERDLRGAERASQSADSSLVKQAERAQRERMIAGEFAKLKQEYELIEIERRTLEGSGVPHKYTGDTKTSVSGAVKKQK